MDGVDQSKPLTPAGRKMIGAYLEAWANTRDGVVGPKLTVYHDLRGSLIREGRGETILMMTLPNGDGASAATIRKLVRDGYADGQYRWTSGRYMRPTDAGVAAYLAEQSA